ncbi:MAG: eukaryotic-like serine/threonine-protein kinase [Solirubrobacteraceae bacterium]|nr:serine/threonine protein kinase [Solirubrobacterales bacterium]MEA2217019.1 eukaryotic-like serine/threonine-protein kinase [Solirubrobacteraceae bacterium]
MESSQTLLNGKAGAGEQLVLGRYRLLAKLGAGGFGVVWRAHDELLQREVAVKRIWLGAGEGSDHAERAAREAQATARLAHPAIVALYEACPQGEAFYLISELVHGQTLGRLIAADTLCDEQILEIGLDLADALEHAHGRGVIHRDIKPQNVLVPDVPATGNAGSRPVAAKLTDFGGASIAEEDALTRTGDVLGTLAYMAPEQSEGREAGEETDLYALALVLYEALCGENPVRGATPAATARRIGTRLEPLGRRRRDLDPELTRALDGALAPDPRDRGTVRELRESLQETLEDGVDAPPRRRIAPTRRSAAATRRQAPVHVPDRGRESPAARRPRRGPLHEQPPVPAELEGLGQGIERYGEQLPPARAVPDHGGLPRKLWVALALVGIAWLAATGKPGASLLLAAALAPLAAMPAEPYSRRVSPVWLVALLAPVLGLAGLAGAYPAVAGQAPRWRQRLVLGALGYWWTVLAEPLLGRRLWLGPPSPTPPHGAWEGSVTSAASHVVGPLLSTGVLFGALLWGGAALLLPWIVRGAHAALDVIAAVVWSAAVCSAAPALASGLHGAVGHASPRGAVLGAVLGGLLAVGARALRGPV